MSFKMLQAFCIAFLLLSVQTVSAQINSLAYQQRQSDLIDSALTASNFNNDALVFQVYRNEPVDTNALNAWIAEVPTKSTIDFTIVKLVRMLFLSNGEYDNWIYSSIDTLPFWVNKADTLYGYWSENHMIQWMSSEWLLNEKFGRDLTPDLENRINHYLDLKIEYGFYEFFSSTYAPYSLGGLMNLADFAQDPTIKSKAQLVAKRLMNDILMLTNDQGTFFPPAGRNYYSKYTQPYNHTNQSMIYLLTGLGQKLTKAQHSSVFLATSDLYIEDVVANMTTQLDTLYSIGHSIDSSRVINSDLRDVDRIMFQWSFGGYFPPEFAYESGQFIIDSMLWGHVDFQPYQIFRTFNATQIEEISEALESISSSTVLSEHDIKIYKNRSVTLSSIQNSYPGKAGYQQFPFAANIGRSAILPASGELVIPWDDKGSNSANEHLPYVEQNSNVALLMYWPENGNVLLNDASVSLYFEPSEMDEIVEDSLWLIARQDNNYVAVRRSCTDQKLGYYYCPTEPVQSWAVIVGDSIMYNSFANFQTLVSNAQFSESITHNATDKRNEYYASVTFDTISIDHTWLRDSLVTGINDVHIDDSAINIYPNPAQNSFNISLETHIQNAQIEVMDLTGRSIYKASGSNTSLVKVDMSDWTNGMYLVHIQHNTGSTTKKLLKTNR